MYTQNDAQQFENVERALAGKGALLQEVCDTAGKAVFARLDGMPAGGELRSRTERPET